MIPHRAHIVASAAIFFGLFALFAPGGDAFALDSRVRVELVADEAAHCPPQSRLVELVEKCMTARPEHWVCPPAVAKVRVLTSAATLDGRFLLRVGGRDFGERRLIGQTRCADVVSAAALAICIGLDALCAEPAPPMPSRRSPALSFRGARRGSVAQFPRLWAPVLSAGALISQGSVPAPNLGLTFSVGARRRRTPTRPSIRLALEGRIDAPATVAFESGRVGASVVLLGGSACIDRRDWSFCAVQYVGLKHHFGVGYRDDASLWLNHYTSALRFVGRIGRLSAVATQFWVQADFPWWVTAFVVQEETAPGKNADGTSDPAPPPELRMLIPPRVGLTVGLDFATGTM